jgi:hypothetical protein
VFSTGVPQIAPRRGPEQPREKSISDQSVAKFGIFGISWGVENQSAKSWVLAFFSHLAA